MKKLFTLASLIAFSATAYAETPSDNTDSKKIHYNYIKTADNSGKPHEITDCAIGDETCLARNDSNAVNKNQVVKKHKKHRSKNGDKRKKIDNQAMKNADKRANAGDADLEDTSKINSFISDTNTNSAPAKSPTTPPNSH